MQSLHEKFDAPHVPLRMPNEKLLSHIKTFGTLAFCRRWLDRPDGGSATAMDKKKQERYLYALKNLREVGIIQPIHHMNLKVLCSTI